MWQKIGQGGDEIHRVISLVSFCRSVGISLSVERWVDHADMVALRIQYNDCCGVVHRIVERVFGITFARYFPEWKP